MTLLQFFTQFFSSFFQDNNRVWNEDWEGETVLTIDSPYLSEEIKHYCQTNAPSARYVIDLSGEYLLYDGYAELIDIIYFEP
ncbi:MAG: hypothetical protein ACWA5R_10055 [bacterium]